MDLKDNSFLKFFEKDKYQFPKIIVMGLFAVALLTFPPMFKLIALLTLIMFVSAFFYYNQYLEDKAKSMYESSFFGQMNEKRLDCQLKISELRKELKLIEGNIKDLQVKLTTNPQATAEAIAESNKLVDGFKEEKKLRQSKISFYELALSKFNQIIKNHELTEDLKEKREKLESLMENNIDEVADMEEVKTFLDYEKTYIETIDELSLQMLESRSVAKADALQLELVEMTKELREL